MHSSYEHIYHYHVRKTAGTSLDAAFWALGGEDMADMASKEAVVGERTATNGLTFVRHDPKLIANGDYFYASSHQPAYELDIPPHTFTITILRDPAARATSYYRYLKWVREADEAEEHEPFKEGILAESAFLDGGVMRLKARLAAVGRNPASAAQLFRSARRRRSSAVARSVDTFRSDEGLSDFQRFLSRVPPHRLFTQLHMFSSRLNPLEAAERVLSCSFVCFTETFSDDLKRLAATVHLDLQERRERGRGADIALTATELDLLHERLAPEYEMLDLVRAGLHG